MPERQEVSISSSQKDWGVDVAAMAGSLVHEIKNPLSTINLSAQLLQEEWKDASTPKEQRALRRLEVMSSEVQRVERIIDTFLRFTVRHKLALEVKSLNEMLEDIAEFMTAKAERSGVQIRLGLSSSLEAFSFDADLVRQVFHNLVQNACQAMSAGAPMTNSRTRLMSESASATSGPRPMTAPRSTKAPSWTPTAPGTKNAAARTARMRLSSNSASAMVTGISMK